MPNQTPKTHKTLKKHNTQGESKTPCVPNQTPKTHKTQGESQTPCMPNKTPKTENTN